MDSSGCSLGLNFVYVDSRTLHGFVLMHGSSGSYNRLGVAPCPPRLSFTVPFPVASHGLSGSMGRMAKRRSYGNMVCRVCVLLLRIRSKPTVVLFLVWQGR